MSTSTLTLTQLNTTVGPTFVDVDMNMSINPLTGDISLKTDIDAVVQNVKNSILLESLWVESGNDITTMLFESLQSPYFEFTLNEKLNTVIKQRDNRIAKINGKIEIFPEDQLVRLDVFFSLVNSPNKYYTLPVFQKIR